jgi:hypothetical protein
LIIEFAVDGGTGAVPVADMIREYQQTQSLPVPAAAVCGNGLPRLDGAVVLLGFGAPGAAVRIGVAKGNPEWVGRLVGHAVADSSGRWGAELAGPFPDGMWCVSAEQKTPGAAQRSKSDPSCFMVGSCETVGPSLVWEDGGLRFSTATGWPYGALRLKTDKGWQYGTLRRGIEVGA